MEPAHNPARHTDIYDFAFLPAFGRLLMAHQRIGPAALVLFQQVMFAPGHLTRTKREMAAAVTSAAQDCCYSRELNKAR
jgi:hypothetical protein